MGKFDSFTRLQVKLIMELTRICKSCSIEQNILEFGEYQIKGRKNRLRRRTCNSCRRLQSIKYYSDNPHVQERMKETAKAYYLMSRYSLSLEEYDDLFKKANNSCMICGICPDSTLNVDHCHTTGKVRGLLCWDCNTGLGKFKDNIESLKRAITYLGG